jgi:serine/threonine protein phosphatase PrpC
MEDGHKVADPLPVHSHIGQGYRRNMEELWRFFAVYDGHGGREAMEWLETHLHHAVATELQLLKACKTGHHDSDTVATAITRAFKKVDTQLASLGAFKYGSTATVALIHESTSGKMLYVANVGDSRAVLIGGQAPKQLSIDHHVSNAAEAARVEQDGGFIFRHRVCGSLSVTRAMGDHELKGEGGGVSCVPDVSACKVSGAKALVIASDGLWDVMDGWDVQELLEEQICQAAQREKDPEFVRDRLCSTAARTLVENAKHRGSHDNICAVVVFL